MHTSAVMIGASKQSTLNSLTHTLGKPIKQASYPKDGELSAVQYRLTTDSNLVVWLYKDKVVQVSLKDPKISALGLPRADYQSIDAETVKSDPQEPKGYFISDDGRETTIKPLYSY